MNKFSTSKMVLLVQLVLTAAIIVYIPNSIIQTILLLLLWVFTFWPLTRFEIVIFVITCVLFTLADILVLQRGVFEFNKVDIWGMPYYEPFVWGFYFLNSVRMLKGTPPANPLPGIGLTVLILLSLSFLKNEVAMLSTAGVFLAGALFLFRTKKDFQYTGYLIFVGFLIELAGTLTGQWRYNISNYVIWWAVTWGASGLILYRAVMSIGALIERVFNLKIR